MLKDQPHSATAALMLADLHAREFRYDQAISVLEAAAREGTGQDPVTLAPANLYIRTGRFDSAIARLAPLRKQNPNLVEARLLSGRAQLSKHHLTGAIAQFEAVTRLNPQLAEPHYLIGRALLVRGDVEGAKREYQRAMQLAPAAKQIAIELATPGGKPDPSQLSSWTGELKTTTSPGFTPPKGKTWTRHWRSLRRRCADHSSGFRTQHDS